MFEYRYLKRFFIFIISVLLFELFYANIIFFALFEDDFPGINNLVYEIYWRINYFQVIFYFIIFSIILSVIFFTLRYINSKLNKIFYKILNNSLMFFICIIYVFLIFLVSGESIFCPYSDYIDTSDLFIFYFKKQVFGIQLGKISNVNRDQEMFLEEIYRLSEKSD